MNDWGTYAVLFGILINFVGIVSLPVRLERRLTKIEVTQQFITQQLGLHKPQGGQPCHPFNHTQG